MGWERRVAAALCLGLLLGGGAAQAQRIKVAVEQRGACIMADAIAFKFIQAALTPGQIDQIVQLERTNR